MNSSLGAYGVFLLIGFDESRPAVRAAMAVGCSLAVIFLLRVLAAFVSDYRRTARASGFARSRFRMSHARRLVKMKDAMQSKGSTETNEKIAAGMTLGTVLTLPVYASWETVRAASPFDVKRQLKAKNRSSLHTTAL